VDLVVKDDINDCQGFRITEVRIFAQHFVHLGQQYIVEDSCPLFKIRFRLLLHSKSLGSYQHTYKSF
jgi:hypothetical protein